MSGVKTCDRCGRSFESPRFKRCFICRHFDGILVVIEPAVRNAQRLRTLVEEHEPPEEELYVEEEEREEKTRKRRLWDRYGDEWQSIREDVLERDNYCCQDCGLTHSEHQRRDDLFPPNKGLHVHHIRPFRLFDSPEEANQLDNLIALCADCHRDAEPTKEELGIT